MELKGLKAVFLGDSITEGVGASSVEKVYWNVLKEKEGIIPTGYGIGGTRIARKRAPSDNPRHDLDFNMRADEMTEDADIVCVFGGTNDFGHGDAPIGSIDDQSVFTFYGALNLLYTKLIKKYPHSFIFVMTPLHRLVETKDIEGEGERYLCDYVDAIRKACDKYSLPVLDLYAMSGMYPQNETVRAAYMPDGLHPNDAGYERIAGMVAHFLKSHYYEKRR